MEVTEGSVAVEVPEARRGSSEGTGDGVFYNPDQELNRDVTVAALGAWRDRIGSDGDEPDAPPSYLDAMAASGIRGVRAAATGYRVTCCDVDGDAVKLAEHNLARNGLDGTCVRRDANAFMHESRYGFDVVDLDPFGTPIPFADAAVRSARDLLCVTATDTAPLCGAHFESGVRTYGAVPRNTEFHPEMGLRVLLSALARTAARYDIAARPVLSHVSNHYVRTYLALGRGATAANDALEELGHVDWCRECLWRIHERGLLADPTGACPNCGASTATAGPLWLGPAHDVSFVRATRERVCDDMGTATRAGRLLDRIAGELHEPTHYDQHRLFGTWGEPATAMEEFLDALRDAGHEASRTHFGGTTFKTTADVTAIRAAALGE